MSEMYERLKTQLIRDEGMVLRPYRDSVGKLTIGIGRNLEDKGLSKGEALLLLENDIVQTNAAVLWKIPCAYDLDEARKGVLFNMAFNLGIAGLLKFEKFLAAVEAKEWQNAHDEMLDSKWAAQVGMRATRLAKQMLTGVWQ